MGVNGRKRANGHHALVLVIADDEVSRKRLASGFAGLGYRAACPGSAAQGLAAASRRQHPFDLAVVDLVEPQQAHATIEGLRRRAPVTEVVALVARGAVEDAVQAMQLGAVTCVERPAAAIEIIDRAALARRRSLPEGLDRLVWVHIQRVLADCGGNKSLAARRLGLSRRGLQLRLQKGPPPS